MERQPRLMVFLGGPYDGASEPIVPTVNASGLVVLCHLTAKARHRYSSQVPLDFLGPEDEVIVDHDPRSVHLRKEAN